MIVQFAQMAREDGQIPLVMLLQTQNPRDPDVLEMAKPVLEAGNIPYFATVDFHDPADLSGFAADKHYTNEVDGMFAQELLKMGPIISAY